MMSIMLNQGRSLPFKNLGAFFVILIVVVITTFTYNNSLQHIVAAYTSRGLNSTAASSSEYQRSSLNSIHINRTQVVRNNSSRAVGKIDSIGAAFVVPDIVHFIWFNEDAYRRRKFHFLNYISILSAYKIHRPATIMLHCNSMPVGQWWTRLRTEVKMEIVHFEPPIYIHGQKLGNIYHRGDIAKLEILLTYGGIYLDYDVIVVNSLHPVRRYDMTLGKEVPPKFIAGVIAARPNATFLRLMHESYRNNYRAKEWDYNCAVVTYELYRNHSDLLHVEPYKLTTPDWMDRADLMNRLIYWDDLYVIHVMGHLNDWEKYNPEYIKTRNTTLCEVMRYIYYGKKDLFDFPTT